MYLMRKTSPEPKCITMCLKKLSGHIRQGFSFSRQHSLFREITQYEHPRPRMMVDPYSNSAILQSYTLGVGLVGGNV